jgi:uncharacterized flavoprotein (TIGR03862 family)
MDAARCSAIVVGGGPAGLMAAETLTDAGVAVDLYDAMPSVGRKFLLAGKGGLNLTHSEPFDAFVARFGARRERMVPLLAAFDADRLRDWARGLGIETFVGTSGRVFPADLKAAPLLRAWLHRLRERGVRFHMRHRWAGFVDEPHTLRFVSPAGEALVQAPRIVLALGGASWPRLGSDGAWVPLLRGRGVEVRTLQPSNCGFDLGPNGWSEFFRRRYAGHPLKNVALAFDAPDGTRFRQPGEFVVTEGGVEGSLVYAASGPLRDAIATHGEAVARLDLLPQRSADFVATEVRRPRGSRSLSTHLKSRLGIDGVKAALLHELLPREAFADAGRLAAAIKSLPLPLARPRPVAEAISSAGGVAFEALDDGLMLRALPGVYCAGEMLDWEAPTGGYLLTASFATGHAAGRAAASCT